MLSTVVAVHFVLFWLAFLSLRCNLLLSIEVHSFCVGFHRLDSSGCHKDFIDGFIEGLLTDVSMVCNRFCTSGGCGWKLV